MSPSTESLNPLTFPLKGSALIEASAGTGKTFTLALLYVRLVLQQGGEFAFEQPLLPPSILVVTFTKAATKELRDRIRQRLVETASVFRAEKPEEATRDSLLLDLRQAVIDEGKAAGQTEPERTLNAAAYRLEFAAQWMDEAAISTIHGWCYRMLKEHAFDSGNLFQQEIIESEVELLQQAAEDYWRHFYLPLSDDELREVLSFFDSPTETRKKTRKLLDHLERLESPQAPPSKLLAQAEEEKQNVLKPLKEKWLETFLPALEGAFDEANKINAYQRAKLKSNLIKGLLDKIQNWAASESEHPGIDYSAKTFQRMALTLDDAWTDRSAIPWDNIGCKALAALPEQLADLPSPYADLLRHAAHWMGAEVQKTKRQQSQISNQDLLHRLDQALQGDRGEQLAESIRKQFPVALVDEFQDTDPVQYRIFDAIYSIKEPKPETAFFMIGDPKQAIYSFRGADIFTYLAAKKATGERQYTLGYNFRSAPQLIAEVNHLFALGEQRARGAFYFKEPESNPIPFFEVKPGKKSKLWLEVDSEEQAPLNTWLITKDEGEDLTKKRYTQQISVITAAQITRLLIAAQNKKAWLVEQDDNGQKRRLLQAADIAVLVRDRNEADAIRQALTEKGVPSVYLSERSSVYQSDAASALLTLLQAIAEPYNDARLRAALALPQLDLSLQELNQLNEDELSWEERVQQFVGYHYDWKKQGSLALIHKLIKDFTLAERLLKEPGGERQITDLLHLAELLQKASIELDGEQALIRHLREQNQNPDENSEAQQVRLESDRQLVQVVTIHKSKGLEYPLVFLPFATSCRLTKSTDIPLETHDEEGQLQQHLQSSPEILAQADAERLAEDLRKLYVALTRASYCQWVGLGEIQDHQHSGMGYLLGVSEEQPLAEAVKAAKLSIQEVAASDKDFEPETSKKLKEIRAPQVGNLSNWWIASYSAIHFQSQAGGAPVETTDAESPAEGSIPEVTSEPETAKDEQTEEESRRASEGRDLENQEPRDAHQGPITAENVLHRFPAGATWGTVLHTLMEWAAVQEYIPAEGPKIKGFAAVVKENEESFQGFTRFCSRRRIQEEQVTPLWEWLISFLSTPWKLDSLGQGQGFALRELKPAQLAVELEFMIESHWVNAPSMDKKVRAQTLNQVERPVAKNNLLNGLLKGFIDLVAEHEGRYYVIDWKSNRLGRQTEDYTQEAMLKQLLSHRYDLQYVLYLVALHRLLKARLPNYDYDQHVGGAIYVFLRGTQNPQTQGLFCDKPPKALIEELDALFAPKEKEQGATL
ncbi:DNA helicase/exodeoxyribonuclease V, beta subunit [Marinospirillum celere]|uniref:RecBCD enzyme subunit RecB n=1 Tax=Marinospirillum celere TaxID=1122252 RepID=A0A1I1EJR2_9GAMM|nr:exodeoxyribonuclease V subunit beta [Marinospirillum celere]SFB86862.1 DNA helicase/exodeoxyribonuclease V, beta subunit [Marinospirillum celere]